MKVEPGKEIKKLREELNLSQERFGKKVGVSGKSISAYETGRVIPPLKIMEKIAKVYKAKLCTPSLVSIKQAIQALKAIKQQIEALEQALENSIDAD